ncbi:MULTISPECIES: hypothetical protein [unclassified Paenibacillus]|uniref:hypothetical protein n=1 Tax=unclassified Paenibacillus TaxID=185978 RepID=UPI0030EEA2B2
MNNFKKITSLIMTLCIVIVFSGSTYANSAERTTENSSEIIPYNLTTDVFDDNNEVVGTKTVDTIIEKIITDTETKLDLKEDIRYTFNEPSSDYARLFQDEIKHTEIVITSAGDYFIDGQQLSDEVLNSEVSLNEELGLMPRYLTEAGGYYYGAYYTNATTSNATRFQCFSYSDNTNFFLDPGGEKWPKVVLLANQGSVVSDFKMYANNVASARSNISTASAALIASGAGILTPGFVLGLIGSSASAYAIYENGNSGRAAIKNAYSVLYNNGGQVVNEY